MDRSIGMIALLVALTPSFATAEDLRERLPARPGGTLRVQLDAGSIEIEGHDEDFVRVDAESTGSASRSSHFEVSGNGADVDLTGDLRGWLSHVLGDPRVRVRIRVPSRYSLDVRTRGGSIEILRIGGSVDARSSGGGISAEEVDGDLELRTSGGPIEASRIRGDLKAQTSGGPIRIWEVTGEVEAKTSGGSISIDEVVGRVRAETSGGPLSVRWRGTAEGSLETSGGGIEVELPESSRVDLDARTSGGQVQIEPEASIEGIRERSRVRAKINGGGGPLKLRTSGGDIRLILR